MTATQTLHEADLTVTLASAYGVRVAALQRLGSEHDRVERVTDESGARYVVKVSAPGDAVASRIAWQHELLRAARAAGVSAQQALPTLDGEDLLVLEDGAVLRLYSWLDGTPLAQLPSHSPALLRDWGRTAAQLANAFEGLAPPACHDTSHHWEATRAREAVDRTIAGVRDPERRRRIERIINRFDTWAADGMTELPRGVVHQDLNDFNVLAGRDDTGQMRVAAVLDFADAMHTVVVAELALAVAYAIPRKPDPLAAAGHVVSGYVERRPLTDAELEAIYPLATARLCVNAATWSSRVGGDDDSYGAARMRHTWPAIERLAAIPPALAHAALAHAAGRERDASHGPLGRWLAQRAPTFARPLMRPPADADLSAASHLFDFESLGDDGERAIATIAGDTAVAGRHLTSRFGRLVPRRTRASEPPSVALGVDIWMAEREPVCAPHDAIVEQPDPLVLCHAGSDGREFWSRWTGVRTRLGAGAIIAAGEPLGAPAPASHSGLSRIAVAVFDDRELATTAPELVPASQVPAWRALSPDPSPLLGIERPADEQWDGERTANLRRRHLASSQRSYYTEPIDVVRAQGVTFADRDGRTYLDAINNVSHVGHGNPAVTAALERQARRLNTNSRFMYDSLSRYAERLAAMLPDPLEVLLLVCTGSEANDLALRISREVTGRRDVIVIDGAYHGNTTAVTDISPNRYKGPGGHGTPAGTHEVAMPDRYRGAYGYHDPDAGSRYADDVRRVADALVAARTPPAAFIAESLMGTAGNIVHPDGYLAAAFDHARRTGALCISDEVQVGFGRFGRTFWGFEDQGVVPDIVTMGKPIGNGHPLAAVATTREIATSFDRGMKYFNTFGGNPVSCEVGLAVLDEIRDRALQHNAAEVGAYFLDRLRRLQDNHAAIGDVRGRGLYIGVDLVSDRDDRTPDAALAERVSEQLKDEGVILIPTGIANNVLKIKPPMTFTREDVNQVVDTLDRVLADAW